MENSKSRKLRTIQMKYPAPYSHSFSSTDPLMNVASKIKKSTSVQENKPINVQISQKDPDPKNILIIKNHLLNDGQKNIKKGQSSDTPLFLIRPIDQSFTRRLSSSAVMHVDIKPHSAANHLEYKNISPQFSSSRSFRNKAK